MDPGCNVQDRAALLVAIQMDPWVHRILHGPFDAEPLGRCALIFFKVFLIFFTILFFFILVFRLGSVGRRQAVFASSIWSCLEAVRLGNGRA